MLPSKPMPYCLLPMLASCPLAPSSPMASPNSNAQLLHGIAFSTGHSATHGFAVASSVALPTASPMVPLCVIFPLGSMFFLFVNLSLLLEEQKEDTPKLKYGF
ncbi:unnamed protein product [Ilex paraguariensis]|uniref:Uncharacterized protein n=1 Tax=Ilex paraguariensis TaxID=185542 RepID=A0ABC8SPE9_9AQUA